MIAKSFIQAISPLLKEHGFKKSNATWRREQSERIAVLNVQNSSWGGDDYYVNLGVYFSAIGILANPTENKCHVQVRLAIEEPELVVENAMSWFTARAHLHDAAQLAESDSKKGLVFKEVRSANLGA
jgi:hypothetical protein